MAFMLIIIFFLAFFIYCSWLNPGDITLYYLADQSISFSPAILILGFILIGLVIGYGAHIYSVITHGVKHWKRDREDKKFREVGAIYREGVGRLLSGDLKKARTLLQKALDRDSKRVETYIAMASLCSQEENPSEGLTLLAKAKELDPKSREVLFKTANLQEELEQAEESIATYQELISLERDNRKALRCLRDLFVKHDRWQEALETQRQVLKAGPGANRIADEKEKLLFLRYEVARLAIADGDTDNAKSELKDIIRQVEDFTPARVTLGDAYKSMGRGDDAVKTWQEGYQKLGKAIFLDRLEDYYMELEDPSSLLGFFRKAVIERGEDLIFRLYYGKLCLRLEMVDEAIEQLQAVESSGLESSQFHLLMAEAHRRRSQLGEAVTEYQKALGVTSRLRLSYSCECCNTPSTEWNSRCMSCGSWGTISLIDRKIIQEARPLEVDRMVIHHGERKEWAEA
jgi:lipopolysaccharide biosynthesis regulator YciM